MKKKKKKVIIIVIQGGAVQSVDHPRDTEIIIKDYDIQGEDVENGNWEIEKDEDGNYYQILRF